MSFNRQIVPLTANSALILRYPTDGPVEVSISSQVISNAYVFEAHTFQFYEQTRMARDAHSGSTGQRTHKLTVDLDPFVNPEWILVIENRTPIPANFVILTRFCDAAPFSGLRRRRRRQLAGIIDW